MVSLVSADMNLESWFYETPAEHVKQGNLRGIGSSELGVDFTPLSAMLRYQSGLTYVSRQPLPTSFHIFYSATSTYPKTVPVSFPKAFSLIILIYINDMASSEGVHYSDGKSHPPTARNFP